MCFILSFSRIRLGRVFPEFIRPALTIDRGFRGRCTRASTGGAAVAYTSQCVINVRQPFLGSNRVRSIRFRSRIAYNYPRIARARPNKTEVARTFYRNNRGRYT